MKVHELRAALAAMPDDAEVEVSYEGNASLSIHGVAHDRSRDDRRVVIDANDDCYDADRKARWWSAKGGARFKGDSKTRMNGRI